MELYIPVTVCRVSLGAFCMNLLSFVTGESALLRWLRLRGLEFFHFPHINRLLLHALYLEWKRKETAYSNLSHSFASWYYARTLSNSVLFILSASMHLVAQLQRACFKIDSENGRFLMCWRDSAAR